MDRQLHIIIIEDTEDDYQLLLLEFKRRGLDVASQRIETAESMREALEAREWDVVISDFTLPQFNAPEALKILQASGKDIPFIIISGTIGEEMAVSSLKAGAHDFLIKGNYARLVPAIVREIREAESRRVKKQAEEALQEKERLLSEAQRIGHVGSWSLLLSDETLQFSDEMYSLFDIQRDEFGHHFNNMLEAIYSADKPVIENWFNNIKTGRRSREVDIRIFRKTGELRYIRFMGEPIFDDKGYIIRITGNAQDITESKLAEIQIRQQLKQLTSLRTIDQTITSSFDLQLMLNTVISQTISQLQVDAVDILLLNNDLYILEYFSGQGFRTGSIKETSLPVNNSSHAGRAANERRLIEIPDLNERPLIRDLTGEGFVFYICTPLITKGKVKGVLETFHRSPFQPYPEWIDFFETLAGQAAIAIDMVNLFEELELSNSNLKQAYDATIEGWSHALDLRDRETEGHTQRVASMSIKLARIMDISEEQLVHMRRGALLHDIGKMGVPDRILLKPRPLNDDEWKIMRQHPKLAYDWLAPIAYLQQSLEIPHCHHEKWDGSGYPRGLKGEVIPPAARIFAVVDVWDALTSDRPYRKAWDKKRAIEFLREQSGKHFEPDVVSAFLQNIESILE